MDLDSLAGMLDIEVYYQARPRGECIVEPVSCSLWIVLSSQSACDFVQNVGQVGFC